jgi:serpin B
MNKLFVTFVFFALFVGITTFYFSDIKIDVSEKFFNREKLPDTKPDTEQGSEPELYRKMDDSAVTVQAKKTFINVNNNFAFELYKNLTSKKSENIFFSPYSISTALSMVYEGARGETAEQIETVFGFSADPTDRRAAVAAIYNDLNLKNSKYSLQVANSLWAQNDYPFLKEYVSVLKNYYAAESNNLDFSNRPEESRKIINSWVEDKTKEKIKDLFPQASIQSDTRLVLANAIYFKGNWARQFDPKNTATSDFYLDSKETIKVSMMNSFGEDSKFNYFEDENLQALKMPYDGEKISMIVLLPKENDLNSISGYLSHEKINEINKSLSETRVNISFPKFTFETKYFMNQTLMEMGMPLAFSNGADFSGMTGNRELKIGFVVHQAFVEVNEEGTEAAAATGVTMVKTSMPTPPIIFNANHPFVFMISEEETGNILFLGKVLDPGDDKQQ